MMNFLQNLCFLSLAMVFSSFAGADAFNRLASRWNCGVILSEGGLSREIKREENRTPWIFSGVNKFDLHLEQYVLYGQCLILNGKVEEGRAFLEELIEEGNIPSAIFLARWTESRANFDNPEEIQEAVLEYSRLLYVIDQMVEYRQSMTFWKRVVNTHWLGIHGHAPYQLQKIYACPDRSYHWYNMPEAYMQAYLKMPELYFAQFTAKLDLEESQVTAGNPPNYEMFSTQSILLQVENYATVCIDDTSYVQRFSDSNPEEYLSACQLLKDTAETLHPLDWQRRQHLTDASCASNLQDCREYQEVISQIDALIQSVKEI